MSPGKVLPPPHELLPDVMLVFRRPSTQGFTRLRKSISWLRSCIPEMTGTRSAPALPSWMPRVASCSWDNSLCLAGENVAFRGLDKGLLPPFQGY